MHLSKRGEYGLRGMIDLAIAQEVGRPLLRAAEVAEKERIPVQFLENIFGDLRIAGFVETQRGKRGGYRLARPAAEIRLGAIIRTLDGPIAPIGCVSQTAYCPCTCPDEEHCGLRMVMLDVRNSIARIVDRYSLADVVEVTLRQLRRDGLPLPFAQAPAPAAAPSPAPKATKGRRNTEGFETNLLPDYVI